MEVRRNLYNKLLKHNVFWSFDKSSISIDSISDEFLIEKVLLHLDIDDVLLLFSIFPEKKIKQIWRDRVSILEPYYHDINNLYAKILFGIKNPNSYMKRSYTNHINKLEKLV
jgi:hypothetical protein